MTRILVVEDNETLALGLARSLESAGFDVAILSDGEGAAREIIDDPPALVVLDLTLPGRGGFSVLREIRDAGVRAPVLILSARGQEAEKVRGFRLGADDYVVKPVGMEELKARVAAILRRARGEGHGDAGETASEDPSDRTSPRVLRFGRVEVDLVRHSVSRAGTPVDLSPLEYDLLVCLLRRDGAVVARDTLLTEVWGYKVPVPTRTVDTHVGNLRAKLEDDPGDPRHIVTVRKVGYRLDR